MFTGIITEIGTVQKIRKLKQAKLFQILAPKTIKGKKIGQSISVNGVCVTITKLFPKAFEFEAIPETLNQSNLDDLKINDEVNLESALKLKQSLDGYLVQGHVDAKGKMTEFNTKRGKTRLKISFPPEISQYLAFKGPITVNGVNLTISDLQENFFKVDLTNYTLENTNLKNLQKNDIVNLETDLIAKYLEKLLNQKEKEAKYQFLKDRNLI